MILGDSLVVMSSLLERERLAGQVQCIFMDPPYGIKYNSNFQPRISDTEVTDRRDDDLTREPEMIQAYRDTWELGIHSYLTYLRDRLTTARDLLTDSGSIFVQIGDENVHRVRALMDEVFGEDNFIILISFQKTGGIEGNYLSNTVDYVLWFTKNREKGKFRKLMIERKAGHTSLDRYDQFQESEFCIRPLNNEEKKDESRVNSLRRFQLFPLYSEGESEGASREFKFAGQIFAIRKGTHWKTTQLGLQRIAFSDRVQRTANTIRYKRFVGDVPMLPLTDRWDSTQIGTERLYVVQTASEVVKRCLLMATDPGDLVLDPTCGSGTTATVAEQWGRRWITIDTSRVALALARARIMGARYPYYLLADSREGQLKEAEITRTAPRTEPVHGHMAHGFVYERVPHITLKSIANNAEIDVIWEDYQTRLEPLREKLNAALGTNWQEWEIPRDLTTEITKNTELGKKLSADPSLCSLCSLWLKNWWEQRIARQKEIDASISAKAESEFLYDKPYQDTKKVRVAGPFTMESVSPHRFLSVDENDEVVDGWKLSGGSSPYDKQQDFATVILENLKTAGVQQAHKENRLTFSSVTAFPGTKMICGEGRYTEGDSPEAPVKRAGIYIGPEFGTVSRPDLVEAAREAGDLGFDVLIACAFNYDAHSSEFEKLGRIPVLKARMNADLHMAGDLKNTGKGNLFVIFGEPDIELKTIGDEVTVRIRGVDVFKPQTGEVVSSGPEGIACWFVDTDYNEESFFVRHAYFLGQNDPYKSLKTTLKAEIDAEAWESLNRDTSRPFPKPTSGRIAVKVINHLGDEVMKVFSV
jgi:adenine-specific DNA-methyltransferase